MNAVLKEVMALGQAGRFADALALCEEALAKAPDNLELLFQRAFLLEAAGQADTTLAAWDRLIALLPDHPAPHFQRARTLMFLKRPEDALPSLKRLAELAPRDANAHVSLGIALWDAERGEEALVALEQALKLNPTHPHALSALAHVALYLCDFPRTTALKPRLDAHVRGGTSVIAPFIYMGFSDNEALLARSAATFLKERMPAPMPALPKRTSQDGRIRLGYLSCDWREHATAYLLAGLFEAHDRTKFETIGLSLGPDDGSAIRARLVQGFDQFHDLGALSDANAAALIQTLGVDILIDINVYTQAPRPGILAGRPAPIQINYLGYPGTSAARFMDYVIADRTVLPREWQPLYSEKIVHLPHCYQVNDDKRACPPAPTRAEAGLPEDGFVFCCFNAGWKLTPAFFDVWMRLLRDVPGSVLWLISGAGVMEDNLRHEAQTRGIDPARLIFAPRAGLAAHLARHRLADLFLDTLPYNAHTTASDALWMGVPLVTVRGTSFAGRVGASLLETMGLNDLVTATIADYEALARDLAHDPARLAAIKDRVAAARLTKPLFDTTRTTRALEAAYETMWARHRESRAPEGFAVPG